MDVRGWLAIVGLTVACAGAPLPAANDVGAADAVADAPGAADAMATEPDAAPEAAVGEVDVAPEVADVAAVVDTAKADVPKVACVLPTTWAPVVHRVSALAIAPTKVVVAGSTCKDDAGCNEAAGETCSVGPGTCMAPNGCDLDGDGKVENGFAKILGLYKEANNLLQEKTASGEVVVLLEAPGFASDGKAFAVHLLQGDLADKACNPQTAACSFTVRPANYDATAPSQVCPAQFVVAKTMISQGKLNAATSTVLPLPLVAPADVECPGLRFRIHSVQGDVPADGPWPATKKGRLCGYLFDAEIPGAASCLGGTLKPDTIVGGKPALAVALDFETVPAQISGLGPPAP